jgi:hypothetical protein
MKKFIIVGEDKDLVFGKRQAAGLSYSACTPLLLFRSFLFNF